MPFTCASKKTIADVYLQFSKVFAEDYVIACVSIGVALDAL